MILKSLIFSKGTLIYLRPFHLDHVHSDQKVLETIRRGKLVLFTEGQESQNKLKEDYEARVNSNQIVLVKVRREAGPCEQRPIQVLHSLRTPN
jgi:hypothetical protein